MQEMGATAGEPGTAEGVGQDVATPEVQPAVPAQPGSGRRRQGARSQLPDQPDRRGRSWPRLGSRIRRVPRIVWLITLLYLGVVLCQSALFPNFRSPDERQQIDLVAQVAEHTWPWSVQGWLPQKQGSRAGGFAHSRIPGQRPQFAKQS